MNQVLTPKELAEAIGVSESSLKRWADDGVIAVSRTAGGHRRIPIAEAIRFVREFGAAIVRPEILGMPDLQAVVGNMPARADAAARLASYLTAGSAREAKGLVLATYMSGVSAADVFDQIIAPAMHQIGELWKHDDQGVFIEHRATDICLQAISQLRAMLPVTDRGLAAVGGAPSGDPYLIPSMMCAIVLAAEGMNAINLGGNTPVSALVHAARQHEAAIVWLSLSGAEKANAIDAYFTELMEGLRDLEVRIVVGGRSRSLLTRLDSDQLVVVSSMSDLATFARGLLQQRS